MAKPLIMKQIIIIYTLCLVALGTQHSKAQTVSDKSKQSTMKTVKSSKEVVQQFFGAFGNGDFNGIINTFHDSCTIEAVRSAERQGTQIFGTYQGKEGAKTFLTNLGSHFDTKAFSVTNLIGEGDVAFANGKFTHVVKANGKTYSSNWALMCRIQDEKIVEYHFYEDSEKFAEANRR